MAFLHHRKHLVVKAIRHILGIRMRNQMDDSKNPESNKGYHHSCFCPTAVIFRRIQLVHLLCVQKDVCYYGKNSIRQKDTAHAKANQES